MRLMRVMLAVGLLAAPDVWAQPTGVAPAAKHVKTVKKAIVPARHGMANTIAIDTPDGVPHTLTDALSFAYESNPQLTGERAHLRATDENVPAALAGWRPTVSVQGDYGDAVGRFDQLATCPKTSSSPTTQTFSGGSVLTVPNQFYHYNGCSTVVGGNTVNQYYASQLNNRIEKQATVTVTQYLYRGGHTTAATHQAVNGVYAERARLIAEEETVLSDTVNAYVGVIEDRQLLELDRANEQVLGDELRAINDRFKVGELTRTDVAQAQAALAQAIATRQTAEGTLQTAAATFVDLVGVTPPIDLVNPQPLKLPVKSADDAATLAIANNPNVLAAKFNEAELRDAVDVAFSALGPQLSFQGQGFDYYNQQISGQKNYGASALLNLTMPLYQGGAEYAAVRQARQNYLQAVRQTEDAQRSAREQAVQAYDTLKAAEASIESAKVAVRSSEIALEGLEREALVGSATTQEVLIGQQNLLTAQITLVQNVTSMVTASYGVASAIGRLTASDMGLQVPLYDETAYYKAVRGALWGTGDRATSQPGR